MTVTVTTPDVIGLAEVVETLAGWQSGDLTLQLHPGDLGWFARDGAEAAAAAVRVWRDGRDVCAVALLDGPEVEGARSPALRITPVDDADAAGYVDVIRSAFSSTRFTLDRWCDLAAGLPATTADHLVGHDRDGRVVGAITAWSAGPGRTGLIEPLGVHAEHRLHGYGRALCLAAAETLRRRGCTVAEVCTPSGLTGAVATYRSAGFVAQPERFDRVRAG